MVMRRLVLVAAACVLWCAAGVRGQEDPWRNLSWTEMRWDAGNTGRPNWRTLWIHHHATLARTLGLDAEQSAKLRGLLVEYETAISRARGEQRAFLDELLSMGGIQGEATVPLREEVYRRYGVFEKARRERFEDDIKALLGPEHEPRWQAYLDLLKVMDWLGALRDRGWFGRGRSVESAVSMTFGERPIPEGVAAVLESHAQELSRITARLSELSLAHRNDSAKLEGEEAVARRRKYEKDLFDASAAIVRLNLETYRKIVRLSDPADVGVLTDWFTTICMFDGMEARTTLAPLDKIREGIAKLTDLTPQQRDAIDAEWNARLDKIRAARLKVYEEQMNDSPDQAPGRDTPGIGFRWLIENQRPIQIEIVSAIRPIFTAEQRKKLPPPLTLMERPTPPTFDDLGVER